MLPHFQKQGIKFCVVCKTATLSPIWNIIQLPTPSPAGWPYVSLDRAKLAQKESRQRLAQEGRTPLGYHPLGAVFCTQSVEAGTKSGTAGTPAEKNDRYKPIANRQGNFPCLFAAEGSIVALELERQNRDVVVMSVNMPHFRRSGNFLGDFLGGKGTVQLQFREDPVIARHSGPVGD